MLSIGFKKPKKAPDQNRTDTSSLEGYGSTIELQAHLKKPLCKKLSFIASSKNYFIS